MPPRFFQHLLACILFRYLNAPILCLSAVSGHSFFCSKIFPCVSQYFSCMYLHVPSVGFNVYASPLISTFFLNSSCFNIVFSLPPMPFNFLHPFRFIRRFPPLASPPLLTFLLFQYVNPPASTTSCTHHVSISPFLPPCARSKKHVQVPKKRCQGLKTSSPMLAPITIEFPPFGGKVHEAGAQLPKKNRGRSCQKKTGLGKDPCRSTQKKKQAPENAQASPPQFLCPQVPQKNPARSGRHVQVQKKDAQVKKNTMHPSSNGNSL